MAQQQTTTCGGCGGVADLLPVWLPPHGPSGSDRAVEVVIVDCPDCDHATCPNCRQPVASRTTRTCPLCGGAILLRRVS